MKKTRKILKIVLIAIIAAVVLLIASTYIFRGKIVSLVKAEINHQLTAKVDFEDADLSFFRHFPRVSIGLKNLSVVGTGPFAADTLLSSKRLDATVDILSFIRGKEMNIYSVFVNTPRIHALVNKEGLANWDIMKPDTTKTRENEPEPFHLNLKKYEIQDGYVYYNDAQSNMSAEVFDLNHSGSGDFNSDLFTLITRTKAGSVTYAYGGIPFLYKSKAEVDADLQIDNKTDKYSFENMNILLNALKVSGSGFFKLLDDGYDMDINFKTPDTDFKNLLSLIPTIYKNSFDKLTANGTASFEGNVKGIFNDVSMPAYHVAMTVKNGAFKYPDLPKGINQININASVDNPDGVTDNTVVDISSASMQMDKNPFSFRLLLKRPLSTMFVDAAAKGNLDLNQIGQFVKLEKGTSINGSLNANVAVKGNVSDLEKQQYQNFFAEGTIDLNKFNYTSKEYPSGIKISSLNTRFTPSKIEIANLAGEYLQTRFIGSGHINNLLNYMLGDKPLSAVLSLNADKVDLNNWMGVPTDTTSSSVSEPFAVPENLNLTLNTKVNQVKYDKLEINNLSGSLNIADQTVKLNDIKGDALGGKIAIGGSYSTKMSKTSPAISMNYEIHQVDIQKTFMSLNTVQKLMPIGKFLSGKLTSSLSANGKLGKNMDVEMNTLNGAGNLLLIEGVLSKFAPLEKIASTLQVPQLQNISMKDVKAFFEFSNGKMLIKPFTLKVSGIEMEIGGLQGFDESIDYAVNMKLPRSFLGAQGNQLINNLASAASVKGIPVNPGETVNLKLHLGGTMKNPTIKTDLKQTGESIVAEMKAQVKDFADAKIESAKVAAADSLNAIKKQVTEAAKKELLNKLVGSTDTASVSGAENDRIKDVPEKAKESAKGLLKSLFNKKKDTSAGNK